MPSELCVSEKLNSTPKLRFLSSRIIDIPGQIILCCWRQPHANSRPDLCRLHASSIPVLHSSAVTTQTQKCFQTLSNIQKGAKLPLVENYKSIQLSSDLEPKNMTQLYIWARHLRQLICFNNWQKGHLHDTKISNR